MEALIAVSPIEVPKALIQAESQQLADNARRDLEMRGLKTKDIPVDPSWFTEQAERRVRLGLVVAELVRANELQAKPEQVRAAVMAKLKKHGKGIALMHDFQHSTAGLAQAEAVVIEDNVVAWVCDKAETTDKPVAFDELMGNNAA